MLTQSERTALGKLGAHSSWAKTDDRAARTSPARTALREKFLAEADGDESRADQLFRAHMARLSLKSAVARRRARELATEAEQAESALEALASKEGISDDE